MKPKIHSIKIHFEIPVSPQLKLPRFVHLFIIEGKYLHLIDSGVSDAMNDIKLYVEKIGRNFSEIKTIVLTHSHPDHIGAAKPIQDQTSCTIYAPVAESNWIENTGLQFKQRPVPGFHELVAGSVTVNRKITDKDVIRLENSMTLQAFSTPGHSAGSTSYFFKEENALFSGDAVLLPGEIPIFENVQEYFHSLEIIKKFNPETLYSAWDKPRSRNEIPEIIKKSETYIRNIQSTVQKVAATFEDHNSIAFCKAVLNELNQNTNIANPLLLKSFLACLHN
ncbi:MAG TPA: MBL fold metallo-hydrolase [Draconibacterium sp.]|nr:MBL fold metallo-hydrolase [Draconibacterium sp.]